MTNQNKSNWLKKAGIAACGVALLLLFLVVFMPAMLPWPRAFDSNEWKSCTDHSIRYAMHKDFLSRHSVIGMTEASLIALLGKPDGRKPDEELSWDMGQAGGMEKYGDTELINLPKRKAQPLSYFMVTVPTVTMMESEK